MKDINDIREDEIRVLGINGDRKNKKRKALFWLSFGIVIVLGLLLLVLLCTPNKQKTETELSYFEPETIIQREKLPKLGREVNAEIKGFCEILDTLEINDIPLRVYIPHNADMSLHIGKMNLQDSTVIYAAQAADIRTDNGKIVGAFVLKGEPKAWGLSKKGFCASIDGEVTVGVADNSPLFEEATDRGGYFFRQYPLVKDGAVVENEPKNKSIRRAICDRQGEIFMAESLSRESFHDFAQALVDLGVDQAIYLVGGDAYGWAFDEKGERHEFGDDCYYTGRKRIPTNISYIVWRRHEN